MSTIAAIATGPAAGGIGIVRVSGPEALAAARRVVPTLPASPPPRVAAHHALVDAEGRLLDEGLVLYFPAPHSFTGEDVVELQLHGSPRLLALVLERVLESPEVRLAQPGEFTRRAFLAGRLDLTRAEAVADLISAESEAQVRAAAAQLSGLLSARLEAVVTPLQALHADLEGVLDFPDEAEGADADTTARLDAALADVRALLADGARGALVRRGARVVLYGPVNAGKSTLFNALVGTARALVDPEPGTTRDALEARLELDGLAVTLVDTAGLSDAPGRVEALGIARTLEALRAADVGVLVLPVDVTEGQRMSWQVECDDEKRLEVSGKADLSVAWSLPGPAPLAVSGLSGSGVPELRRQLVARLGGGVAAAAAVSSQRHLEALRRAVLHLEQARVAVDVSTLEVVAGEVGLALGSLHEVSGTDASAALLDAIFARFCIGK